MVWSKLSLQRNRGGSFVPLPVGIRQSTGFRTTLVVAFSGLYEMFGWVPRLHAMGLPSISLSNEKADWYVTGCDGVSSEDEMLSYLKPMIAATRAERVMVIGQSMGGYAALKYGPLLKADMIVAFCPQTHFMDDPSREDVNLLRIHPEAADVRPALIESQIPTRIIVSRSENSNPPNEYFWDDFGHLQGLDNIAEINIHVANDDDHRVTLYIARSGKMIPVLESMVRICEGRVPLLDLDAL